MAVSENSPGDRRRLGELAAVFLRLGATAFGGPAAHIAMMRDEVVRRRAWLSDAEFLDLLGATNLIPGPNSTELAIHLGYRRAGWPGLAAAGVAFIVPAVLIVTVLAWAYVRFGTTPQADWILYGIKPVVVAIVLHALWTLGRAALRGVLRVAAATVTLGLYVAGVGEIPLLFGVGLTVMALTNLRRARSRTGPTGLLSAVFGIGAAMWSPTAWAGGSSLATPAVGVTLGRLFLLLLKIGSVLYGSGYVLLAFLRRDFVERLGWLTDRQLLDAVAIGQVTPGPVFTTATFVGYILGGLPGAIVATTGIFLPSFVLVAASHPFIPRLRRSSWAAGFLDGVNAAALALMAGVTGQLARVAVVDLPTLALAAGALVLLLWLRVNSTWLIAGGAVAGVVWRLIG